MPLNNWATKRQSTACRQAAINFSRFTFPNNRISHGYSDADRSTPLAAEWFSFGGETALVLILEKMVRGDEAVGEMETGNPNVFNRIGFIAEIQSMFFPEFGSRSKDVVAGVD